MKIYQRKIKRWDSAKYLAHFTTLMLGKNRLWLQWNIVFRNTASMSQQPLAQSDQKSDQSNQQQNNQNQHNNSVGKTQLPQRNLLLRITLYIIKFFHLLLVIFKGFYLIFSKKLYKNPSDPSNTRYVQYFCRELCSVFMVKV